MRMRATKRLSDEATKGRKQGRFPSFPSSLRRLVASSLILLLPSCTHNSGGDQPETFNQKQEDAVRDPMNYKPDNENTKPYDISGGGFNNFDKKSFKKDLDNVLSP